MKSVELRVAVRNGDVMRAQYLIVDMYHQNYGILFSNDIVDLNSGIEPYPQSYLLGTVGSEVVAACGLYTRDTYCERYGEVTKDDLQQQLASEGLEARYDVRRTVEVTKLVIRSDYNGRGLGRWLFQAAHSAAFVMRGDEKPPLILCCATRSIFAAMHEASGIRARPLRKFPDYPVHERYRSADNPMDSRLIIPTVDIPPAIWNKPLPCALTLEER